MVKDWSQGDQLFSVLFSVFHTAQSYLNIHTCMPIHISTPTYYLTDRQFITSTLGPNLLHTAAGFTLCFSSVLYCWVMYAHPHFPPFLLLRDVSRG